MIIDYLRLNGWLASKTTYYGHTRSWSQMGSAVSSLAAAALVVISGNYQVVFLFSTIPYFLNLLMMATYPKELDGLVGTSSNISLKLKFRQVFSDLRHTCRKPAVLKAVANLSFYTGFYKASKDYLQPLLETIAISMPLFLVLHEKQRSAVLIGVIFFLLHLVTALASRSSGLFARSFSFIGRPLNLTLIAGFIFGLVAGIFYSQGWMIAAAIFFVLIYAVENLRKPAGISYLTDHTDHTVLSSALSFQSLAETLVAAALAPLIGWIADEWDPGIALMCVSALMLITPVFVRIKK